MTQNVVLGVITSAAASTPVYFLFLQRREIHAISHSAGSDRVPGRRGGTWRQPGQGAVSSVGVAMRVAVASAIRSPSPIRSMWALA